jgi:hypothetical protein
MSNRAVAAPVKSIIKLQMSATIHTMRPIFHFGGGRDACVDAAADEGSNDGSRRHSRPSEKNEVSPL